LPPEKSAPDWTKTAVFLAASVGICASGEIKLCFEVGYVAISLLAPLGFVDLR